MLAANEDNSAPASSSAQTTAAVAVVVTIKRRSLRIVTSVDESARTCLQEAHCRMTREEEDAGPVGDQGGVSKSPRGYLDDVESILMERCYQLLVIASVKRDEELRRVVDAESRCELSLNARADGEREARLEQARNRVRGRHRGGGKSGRKGLLAPFPEAQQQLRTLSLLTATTASPTPCSPCSRRRDHGLSHQHPPPPPQQHRSKLVVATMAMIAAKTRQARPSL